MSPYDFYSKHAFLYPASRSIPSFSSSLLSKNPNHDTVSSIHLHNSYNHSIISFLKTSVHSWRSQIGDQQLGLLFPTYIYIIVIFIKSFKNTSLTYAFILQSHIQQLGLLFPHGNCKVRGRTSIDLAMARELKLRSVKTRLSRKNRDGDEAKQ